MLKANALLVVARLLQISGFAAILYFAAVAARQFGVHDVGAWIPLASYAAGVAAGGAGVVLLLCGLLIARRQGRAVAIEELRRAERLRRIDDYRRDDSRIAPVDPRLEPYLGHVGGEMRERRDTAKRAASARA